MTDTATSQRILVVEDSSATRRLIELCLQDTAWEVDMQGDGASALAAADLRNPDLVILDIGLPDIDGWEVLEQLRKRPGSDVSVLVITAHADAASRLRAEVDSVDGFLPKPFHPDELRDAVDLLVCG